MPNAPLRPCPSPQCPNLVRKGYCDTHRKARERERKARPDRQTDIAFFNSREWKALRREALRRDLYTCQECKAPQASGLHVHHVLSRDERPDLALVLENVTCLCAECHSRLERRF